MVQGGGTAHEYTSRPAGRTKVCRVAVVPHMWLPTHTGEAGGPFRKGLPPKAAGAMGIIVPHPIYVIQTNTGQRRIGNGKVKSMAHKLQVSPPQDYDALLAKTELGGVLS